MLQFLSMTLIKSISGIRGTIGGVPGNNLTPLDTIRFVSAYGSWLVGQKTNQRLKVVVGRDARVSGEMMEQLVVATLQSLGIDVISTGLSTTPTVELMVPNYHADGGIILTASHNPAEWNALKLLNAKGEFISGADGEALLALADSESFEYVSYDKLGRVEKHSDTIEKHIKMVLDLPLVNIEAIKKANFSVAVDAVNSTGGIAIPALLKALGVSKIHELYCEPNGLFPHNPEPLAENLKDISNLVIAKKADVGIVVDPDVDRLAIINEDGSMFGEEYTLVACADYVLGKTPGTTVSNLSSSRALADVTEKYGQTYTASAVGEVNVVTQMKAVNAIIGGEGNGGIIYPESHYGRDSLVGVALFLSHLAEKELKCSELKASYSAYYMSKNKIQLEVGMDVDGILESIHQKYAKEKVNNIDGVKIDFESEWVHLRKSNTEPIIRIYTESKSQSAADSLAERFMTEIKAMC
ncbi:MAG: phosphomannomutase [Candidatus Azotimanducaceae bacterium]